MAKFIAKPTVRFAATFEVTEGELRALDAIAGYGPDAFINTFRRDIGAAYLADHEDSLRAFLTTVLSVAPGVIARIDAARDALAKQETPDAEPSE